MKTFNSLPLAILNDGTTIWEKDEFESFSSYRIISTPRIDMYRKILDITHSDISYHTSKDIMFKVKESFFYNSCNAMIVVPSEDEYDSIYCHYDGEPEYLGAILHNFINTKDDIKQLIENGSIKNIELSDNDFHVNRFIDVKKFREVNHHETIIDAVVDFFESSPSKIMYVWNESHGRWVFLVKDEESRFVDVVDYLVSKI